MLNYQRVASFFQRPPISFSCFPTRIPKMLTFVADLIHCAASLGRSLLPGSSRIGWRFLRQTQRGPDGTLKEMVCGCLWTVISPKIWHYQIMTHPMRSWWKEKKPFLIPFWKPQAGSSHREVLRCMSNNVMLGVSENEGFNPSSFLGYRIIWDITWEYDSVGSWGIAVTNQQHMIKIKIIWWGVWKFA